MSHYRLTMKRGAIAVLNAMQNGNERRFAAIDSVVGEKPHAAVIAATEEDPALLRAILRLVKKYAASAAPGQGGRRAS